MSGVAQSILSNIWVANKPMREANIDFSKSILFEKISVKEVVVGFDRFCNGPTGCSLFFEWHAH